MLTILPDCNIRGPRVVEAFPLLELFYFTTSSCQASVKKEVSLMIPIDDLWLASYLVAGGAKLAGVSIFPYNSGSRLRAVFELDGVKADAIESYSSSDPLVKIHELRTSMNKLRDLMYAELEKRNGNGSIKAMPNGRARRRGENENRSIRHR